MSEGVNKSESDSPLNGLSRTTIREANHHLQMLHKHNQELEQIISKQKQEIEQKDRMYMDLFKVHQSLEKHYQQLQIVLEDRTRRLQIYDRKERLFRETLELKPAIESLLDVLNTFEKEDSMLSTIPKQSVNQKKPINNVHTTDAV